MKKLLVIATLAALSAQGAYARHDTFKNDTPWHVTGTVHYFGCSDDEIDLAPGQSMTVNAGGCKLDKIESTVYVDIVSDLTKRTELSGVREPVKVERYHGQIRTRNTTYMLRPVKNKLTGERGAKWVRSTK